MVTIKFDDPNFEENVKAILELQKAGVSDKVIQEYYDQEYDKSKTKDVDTELHLPGEIMTGEEIKAISGHGCGIRRWLERRKVKNE